MSWLNHLRLFRMPKILLKFRCPKYYDLYNTCHSHGWKNLAPFYWDYNNKTINFAIFLGGLSIDISATQNGSFIKVTVASKKNLNIETLEQIKECLRRSLGLDIDTSELLLMAEKIGFEYAELIKKGAGRLLRSPTLWEDAAKTLFTTNCSWSLTKKMCDAVCSEAFVPQSPLGIHPFPQPFVFLNKNSEELKKLMPIGYRANYLSLLAKRFSNDPDLKSLENNGLGYQAAKKIACELKGFGPYACAHLLVLSGHYNEIPIDTVVVSYLKRVHRVRKPQSFIKRQYRKWGDYTWWGLKLEKMINRQNWLGD
jgi:3-methyladenine DNA glycosylase/8-oxoguanine DNA glycosylase